MGRAVGPATVVLNCGGGILLTKFLREAFIFKNHTKNKYKKIQKMM
jgi:hypothetical protein